MPDEPDIYIDVFLVTVTPYGVTVTLQRTTPGEDDSGATAKVTVGRVRMSRPLAQELGDVLTRTLVSTTAAQEGPNPIKH